jgi:transcriptional repressor NrdR
MGETEIESRIVGEELMKELHQLDQVAYVRFASVYREFKDIDQFMDELRTLAQQRRERGRSTRTFLRHLVPSCRTSSTIL